MSAPLRIRQPGSKATGKHDELKPYLDRLLKLIPAEVLSLYLVGTGVIPKDKVAALAFWGAVCLVATVVVKAFGTSDRRNGLAPDKIHVALSAIAFLIWTYSLGGPWVAWNLYESYIGSLMILAFTFFVPYAYRGQPDR
jgi:hypothetical protein